MLRLCPRIDAHIASITATKQRSIAMATKTRKNRDQIQAPPERKERQNCDELRSRPFLYTYCFPHNGECKSGIGVGVAIMFSFHSFNSKGESFHHLCISFFFRGGGISTGKTKKKCWASCGAFTLVQPGVFKLHIACCHHIVSPGKKPQRQAVC